MSVRYSTPAASEEFTLQGGVGTAFPTGGVGTYGVRIDTGAGATAVARSVAGIVEEGVGIYVATVTVPSTLGSYVVIWDNGAGVEVADSDTLTIQGALPGTGLVSSDDLDDRGITYTTPAQAAAAIADASAVARSYVAPIFDDVVSPNAPASVVAIVCGMVRRLLVNPVGLAQETLGDYSYQAGMNGVATLLPTARERRMLRQAATAYALAQDPVLDVPAWGSAAPYMQVDLPSDPFDDLGLV